MHSGHLIHPGFDTINRGNLNVHLSIPVFSKPGRGGADFFYALRYDGLIWKPTVSDGSSAWTPVVDMGVERLHKRRVRIRHLRHDDKRLHLAVRMGFRRKSRTTERWFSMIRTGGPTTSRSRSTILVGTWDRQRRQEPISYERIPAIPFIVMVWALSSSPGMAPRLPSRRLCLLWDTMSRQRPSGNEP